MTANKVGFIIAEEYECPIYESQDKFSLEGNSLYLPKDKPACIELVKDLTEFINVCTSIEISNLNSDSGRVFFNCSGCTGLVRLEYIKEKKDNKTAAIIKHEKTVGNIARMLSNFSMFQTLSEYETKDLVSFLKLDQYNTGDDILKKGDPGTNLYIIISGKVEVLDSDGNRLAFLEKGEVFGEMSLLSGDPVTATIRVVDKVKLLYLNSKDFRRVLHKYPSLQMYLARLLTKRLAKTTSERSEDLSAVMSGTLAETSASELFQTFNVNEKTGVLTLQLASGEAELSFNKGQLISAKYLNKEDKDAFFELLKEKDGRFKFIPGLSSDLMGAAEIGHFMCLLMEGLSKMDEEEYARSNYSVPVNE